MPGLHVEPEAVLGKVALDQLDLLRARADDAHVAAQDVDELRQLVEAEAAQQPPDPGDPRIGAQLEHRLGQVLEHHDIGERPLGVGDHRAQLVHAEGDAAPVRPAAA